jgi:hypothetical protein
MFNWLPCGLQAQKAFPAHECTDQQQAQELHAALKEGLLLLNGHSFLISQVSATAWRVSTIRQCFRAPCVSR